MQHGHALDNTLDVELVVTLRWLSLKPEPRFDISRLGIIRCWTCYQSAISLSYDFTKC